MTPCRLCKAASTVRSTILICAARGHYALMAPPHRLHPCVRYSYQRRIQDFQLRQHMNSGRGCCPPLAQIEKCVCGGGGGGAVRFLPNTRSWGGWGGGGYNPSPPPPPPPPALCIRPCVREFVLARKLIISRLFWRPLNPAPGNICHHPLPPSLRHC